MLAVKVIGGRNWTEPKSASDVPEAKQWCTVEFAGKTKRTEVYDGPAKEPIFNATFQFECHNLWHEDIIITGYRKGSVADKTIGQVRLKLEQHKDVPFKFALEHWYSFGSGGGKKDKAKTTKAKKKDALADTTLLLGEVGVVVGTTNAKEALLDGKTSNTSSSKHHQVRSKDDAYLQARTADEIYDEAIDQAGESVAVVKSMNRLVDETKTVATKTMSELQRQNEIVAEAHEDLDDIGETMKEADRKIKSIGNCCYTIKYYCCGGDKHKKKRDEIYAKDVARRGKRKRDAVKRKQEEHAAAMENAGRRGGRGTVNDNTQEYLGNLSKEEMLEHQQKQIDAGLDALGDGVSDLKNMAQEMADEIGKGMEPLDELVPKINDATAHVEKDVMKVKSLG